MRLSPVPTLSSVSSTASSYSYSNYDALGRPGAGTQTTNGQAYNFTSLAWTPQGQISSITYPSGRTVTTSFDVLGRPVGVGGSLNNGPVTTYASGVSYAAQGGLATLTTGDGLARSIAYNDHLQMTSVAAGSLLSLGFGYSGTQNNGNLLSQTIAAPGFSATQNYGYDGANRLTSASEGSTWGQTYVYDNVGNRAVLSSSNIIFSDATPQTGGLFRRGGFLVIRSSSASGSSYSLGVLLLKRGSNRRSHPTIGNRRPKEAREATAPISIEIGS